jgi:threonyl-tRNA synthetase
MNDLKTEQELMELQTLRHSASHLLAHAVKRLFPAAKLGIGPAIENGFYYDFDYDARFSEEDLVLIEKEMEKIKGERIEIERFELPREDAVRLMEEREEPYKVQLIHELPENAVISFYKQGDFIDLCAGPHLENVRKIKAFKLMSLTGAYWKGNDKNKMLQRIYGTAFGNGNELTDYLKMLEEAKLRDHNKLGRELEMFTTVDVIGQGLPLLMPKGAKIIQILQRFVEDEEERRGYLLTKTPLMAKKELYEISGHWQHYKEGMFVLGDEEKDKEVLALRPMTCPFQYYIYKSKLRSYRDLPLRYGETSTLFRKEESGEMHGLIRVRQFTISEGHLICRPDQLSDEFKGVVDLVKYMMKTLGIEEDVSYRFSKWDPNNREKYVGAEESWEAAQSQMRQILDELGLPYKEVEGEAAFYGPKLDVQMKNVFGKEDTMITIQIDLALAENFDMSYVDTDGQKKRPYIIHRTSIGCYERTLAMLIEKYAGAFPLWLAPVQVKVMTVTDKFSDYAKKVTDILKAAGLRVELDDRNEKIGYKIREARNERVPYLAVIGEKEAEAEAVSVRSRKDGELGQIPLQEFLGKLISEVAARTI